MTGCAKSGVGEVFILEKFTRKACKKGIQFAIAAAAIAITTVASPALAASTGVPFAQGLTAPNGCFIFIRRNGSFGINPEHTIFDSKFPGGQSAIADVFSYFPYDVEVAPIDFFLPGPSGGSTDITTYAYFSGQPRLGSYPGGTWAELDHSQAATLPSGNSYTRVTINMRVEKPTPFPAGSYTGHVLLSCL